MALVDVVQRGPNYGVDLDSLDDLNPRFQLVSGKRLVAQSMLHRFQTPRGRLRRHPEYGLDLRAYLFASMSPLDLLVLESGMVEQALQDDRVDDATAKASLDPSTGVLRPRLELVTTFGVVPLVFAVTRASTELLNPPA
jgi:hypothetical protein